METLSVTERRQLRSHFFIHYAPKTEIVLVFRCPTERQNLPPSRYFANCSVSQKVVKMERSHERLDLSHNFCLVYQYRRKTTYNR